MSATAVTNCFFLISSKLLEIVTLKFKTAARDSLYIFTGNSVTTYFRSAANRMNVFILGHVWVAISRDNGSTDSQKVYCFGNCDLSASFPLV